PRSRVRGLLPKELRKPLTPVLSIEVDLDAAFLLSARQLDFQHAVLQRGVDVVRDHLTGQQHLAAELAIVDLPLARRGARVGIAAFALDDDTVSLKREIKIDDVNAGQIDEHAELL